MFPALLLAEVNVEPDFFHVCTVFCAIIVGGAVGGGVNGLIHQSDYQVKIPFTGRTTYLGFLGDFVVGAVGGLAVFLVAAPLFQDRWAAIRGDPGVALQIVAISVVSGFSGRSMMARLSKQMLHQIDQLFNKVEELDSGLGKMRRFSKSAQFTDLADFYKSQGNYQMASEFYSRALDVDEENVGALLNQAYVLKRIGGPKNLEMALRHVDRALAVDPTNERALYNRACYLALLGSESSEVVRALRAAVKVSYYYSEVALQDSDFDAYRDDQQFKDIFRQSTSSSSGSETSQGAAKMKKK